MDETYEVCDFFRLDLVFEGGHPVAAVIDSFGELLVRVFECVAFLQTRNFEFQALDFDNAAVALLAVTGRAVLSIVGAREGQIICDGCSGVGVRADRR